MLTTVATSLLPAPAPHLSLTPHTDKLHVSIFNGNASEHFDCHQPNPFNLSDHLKDRFVSLLDHDRDELIPKLKTLKKELSKLEDSKQNLENQLADNSELVTAKQSEKAALQEKINFFMGEKAKIKMDQCRITIQIDLVEAKIKAKEVAISQQINNLFTAEGSKKFAQLSAELAIFKTDLAQILIIKDDKEAEWQAILSEEVKITEKFDEIEAKFSEKLNKRERKIKNQLQFLQNQINSKQLQIENTSAKLSELNSGLVAVKNCFNFGQKIQKIYLERGKNIKEVTNTLGKAKPYDEVVSSAMQDQRNKRADVLAAARQEE